MKNTTSKITSFLLLALVLCACNGNLSQTTEISDNESITYASAIPPTVTDIAPPTQRPATATWYLKTATPILPTPPPDDIGYYEGIIVITQYYTFLGHGLYEEAYQLLSSSAQVYSVEEFVKQKQLSFKNVKILTIKPFYMIANKGGGYRKSYDSMNMRQFNVSYITWDEENMSESAMNGQTWTFFIWLVREDGEWKIDKFSH